MVYLFLAEGFEEIEALTVVDVLRRAKVELCTVGIGSKNVSGSHSITVVCDKTDEEVGVFDDVEAVVLPGGMPGTLNLEQSNTVQSFIDFAVENNILIAAICAAPTILGHKGLLNGKKATCFPGYENDLIGATVTGGYVEKDGNIITAKGMGVSLDFALCVTQELTDKKTADRIKKSLQTRESNG